MRKLLNNPWVVLGLCSVALVIVYFSADTIAIQPATPQSVHSGDHSLISQLDSVPIESATIDSTSLGWPTTVLRDPFAPFSLRRADAQPFNGERGQSMADDDPVIDQLPPLQLTAVALNPVPKIAMINRKVVAEGDHIEGLRVTRIESDGVWINGPEGPHHLEFELTIGAGRTGERREEVRIPRQTILPTVTERESRASAIESRDCLLNSTCS